VVKIDELAVGDDVEPGAMQHAGDPVNESGSVGTGDPQYVGQLASAACLKVEVLRSVCVS
jgi:hypothetical protein